VKLQNIEVEMNTIIVGAGMSGLTAAILLAKKGEPVTVLEKNSQAGKKILATGNGRCNIANRKILPEYYSGDKQIIDLVMSDYSLQNDIDFLFDLGIPTTDDGSDRLYPQSFSALSVRDLFYNAAVSEGVNFIFDTEVEDIQKDGEKYLINQKYTCDKLILACGGKAQADYAEGMFDILENFGISHTPLLPALTSLKTKDVPYIMKGVRAECSVCIFVDGKFIEKVSGEVQFNEKNVSGIPIMNISHIAAQSLNEAKKAHLIIDKLPFEETENIIRFCENMKRKYPDTPAKYLLSGYLNNKLFHDELRILGIKPDTPIKNIKSFEPLVKMIKNMKLDIHATGDFDNAQVMCGGIPCSEINKNLELKKLPNVFVLGEMLDVTGECGGYNLTFCRQTAFTMLKNQN